MSDIFKKSIRMLRRTDGETGAHLQKSDDVLEAEQRAGPPRAGAEDGAQSDSQELVTGSNGPCLRYEPGEGQSEELSVS